MAIEGSDREVDQRIVDAFQKVDARRTAIGVGIDHMRTPEVRMQDVEEEAIHRKMWEGRVEETLNGGSIR